MENVTETKECICMKCQGKYQSADELDQDGDGKCEKCKEESKTIAAKIDADFAERRKNQVKVPKMKNPAVYFEQDGRI